MKAIIFAMLALAGLAGCAAVTDAVTTGRMYSAYTAAALVQSECSLSNDLRKQNAAAVADQLTKDGSKAKFLLDCDGDGNPDF